ncbi:MAG TPA: amidase family protein, partial [Polyangia bacterium]|nr:amidase family protein [Polyangia bacterium]
MMTIEQKGTAAATQNKGIHQAPPTNGGICALSASTLAALIRRGEISAVAAVEAYIERLQAVNPALNALVVPRFAEARAEAAEIDRRRAAGQALGPLAGVPVTVKECLDLAGTPSTGGVPSRQRVHAKDDERHVARLRAAGAVVLGKTNVGQLLLMIETDNPLYGRTNHPQSAERSPGGSSGGEGALLAAGASAL